MRNQVKGWLSTCCELSLVYEISDQFHMEQNLLFQPQIEKGWQLIRKIAIVSVRKCIEFINI